MAIGQINTIIGDFKKNREKILLYSEEASKKGAEMVVFPEMSICGYPPMDLLDHAAFAEENVKSLRWLQKKCPPGIAVVVGYVDKNPLQSGKPLQNFVSVILDGEIVHTQAKSLLPTYDVFDEARYFETAVKRRLFKYKGERIGFAICEDIWWEQEITPGSRYPIDPVRDYLNQGATLIVSPSASPFYTGKSAIRLFLLSRIGKTSGVAAVYVNMVGGNDSLIFDGHSMVTSSEGKLIFQGKKFEEELSIFELEKDRKYPELKLNQEKYKDIEGALIIGLKDYLDKCGFNKAHLGLSGGVDSALVAVLAVKALGANRVRAFALPSPYSSEASLRDAESLSKKLDIRLDVFPIEKIFSSFLEELEPVFRGREPDKTEENIQARIRGTLLMGYSNKWDSLLLATGNKSELATGYCTLYGDMAGGLAVIGDLFKTEVYELCKHINSKDKIIPDSILAKAPSAELKPDQKDQDTLPPYEVLDRLLTLYILNNLTHQEIVDLGFEPQLVHKVLTMVGRAEYKRRQAPPVLKVSPRAFGTGRRMPIAREIYETFQENSG